MQKYTLWIVITAICSSLIPHITSASSCSPVGYTVEFVNGVLNTREQAQVSATSLEYLLKEEYKGEPLTVRLAYNQTHVAGVGDIAESISQALFAPISDYDKNTMLWEIASHAATRKLLVVGHSQGALYANSLYEYFTGHGVPGSALDVYALATPASYVAGGGLYGTFKSDMVINTVRYIANVAGAPTPLPGNLAGPGLRALFDLTGAHTVSSYLEHASEQIKRDIFKTLDGLKANQNPEFAEGCVPAPSRTASDTAQYIAFGFADPVAHTAVHSIAAAAKWGSGAAVTLVGSVGQFLSNPKNNPVAAENDAENFQIIKSLYGSSLDMEAYTELNGLPQGNINKTVASVPHLQPIVSVPELSELPKLPPAATSSVTQPVQAPKVVAVQEQQIVMPRVGGSSLPSFPISSPVDNSNEPPEPLVSTSTAPDPCVSDPLLCQHATSSDPVVTPPPMPPATSTAPEPPPPVTPTPLPPLEHPVLADTFDAFNVAGWVAVSNPFGEHKLFDYIDGSDGSCVSGGCVVGNNPALGYNNTYPIMALMGDVPRTSGSYTLYAKASGGFNNPDAIITICQSGFEACNEHGDMKGIHFFGEIPADGEWHHYFIAWRQGADLVQKCILQDVTNESLCNWVNSDIPSGIIFTGIALWSQHGYRNDWGHNIWFDELAPQVAGLEGR